MFPVGAKRTINARPVKAVWAPLDRPITAPPGLFEAVISKVAVNIPACMVKGLLTKGPLDIAQGAPHDLADPARPTARSGSDQPQQEKRARCPDCCSGRRHVPPEYLQLNRLRIFARRAVVRRGRWPLRPR